MVPLRCATRKTGNWKFLKINFLVDGWESSADIYLCSGSFASAIMGEQDFDYVEERDESAPSKKERRLNEIDTWFDKRVRQQYETKRRFFQRIGG